VADAAGYLLGFVVVWSGIVAAIPFIAPLKNMALECGHVSGRCAPAWANPATARFKSDAFWCWPIYATRGSERGHSAAAFKLRGQRPPTEAASDASYQTYRDARAIRITTTTASKPICAHRLLAKLWLLLSLCIAMVMTLT
jgi:hypothetical protein